ncbi:MAG: glycosyltransferase family 1 protein [Bacillota bacterium]
MKISFIVSGAHSWQGSFTYIKGLAQALKFSYKDGIEVSFIISSKDVPTELKETGINTVSLPSFPRGTPLWAIEGTIKHLFSYDIRGFLKYKQLKTDVLFGHVVQHRNGSIPTLSWIPDLQHVHLPEMFEPSERRWRNRVFLKTAKISSRIVLMSDAVEKDFKLFAPKYAHKARVIKTVSFIPESVYDIDSKCVSLQYHLPERFIYLPNRFWRHKNHELVFRVLRQLKDEGIKVFIVCSGYPGDRRYPNHFSDLLQKISVWGIRDQVAILGVIPREHIFPLMRQSVCVINPSLFEGLGLTVNEAWSLGKRVILSDIPAHRDQNPPQATFFNPYSEEDIAFRLKEMWLNIPPGPDNELEEKARQDLPVRLNECAGSFLSVTREVTDVK